MNALEELVESDSVIDRSYVERRVDDWRHRIDGLYSRIADWLPDGWAVSGGESVSMLEDLMRRFDMPAVDLPALALTHDGAMVGRLEPRGLWIIGANGRVDLTGPGGHFLFVDRSESFEDANWRVASIHARRDEKALSEDVIRNVLG